MFLAILLRPRLTLYLSLRNKGAGTPLRFAEIRLPNAPYETRRDLDQNRRKLSGDCHLDR